MKYNIEILKEDQKHSLYELALRAHDEHKCFFNDWKKVSEFIKDVCFNSKDSDIIVATNNNRLLGAIIYTAPKTPKLEMFPESWSTLTLLVVEKKYRGLGIGKKLSKECIRRAKNDNASHIGLITSKIMDIALPMYIKMGFVKYKNISDIYGVSYAIYEKKLT